MSEQTMPRDEISALRAQVRQLQAKTTAQAAQIGRLKYDATHDAMTGLYNRAGLFERSTEGLRYVTIIDADGLKQINDTLGHQAGDVFLQSLAKVLEEVAIRAGGFAGRIGGDEFAIFSATIPVLPVDVNASMGTARMGHGNAPVAAAMRAADQRMYEHKSMRKASARGMERAA